MRSLFVTVLAAGVLTLVGGCGKKDSTSGTAAAIRTPEGTYLITGMWRMDGEKHDRCAFRNCSRVEDRIVKFSGNEDVRE